MWDNSSQSQFRGSRAELEQGELKIKKDYLWVWGGVGGGDETGPGDHITVQSQQPGHSPPSPSSVYQSLGETFHLGWCFLVGSRSMGGWEMDAGLGLIRTAELLSALWHTFCSAARFLSLCLSFSPSLPLYRSRSRFPSLCLSLSVSGERRSEGHEIIMSW